MIYFLFSLVLESIFSFILIQTDLSTYCYRVYIQLTLGVVNKLCLQDKVGKVGGLKMSTFVNVHTIKNVNAGG